MLKKKTIQTFQQLINEWNTNNNYTEKSIEFAYYNLIEKYYSKKYTKKDLARIEYNSPYSSDGIITIKRENIDYSILIEAKHDKNYHNKKDLTTVLCQAVYYLKRLENEGELLPAVILLVSKNNSAIIRTEQLVNYLFNSYDWDQPANQAFTNTDLYDSLLNDTNLQPLIYDLFDDNINDYLNKIDDYCINSSYKREKIITYQIGNSKIFNSDLKYSCYNLALEFNDFSQNNYFYNVINDKWYKYTGNYWEITHPNIIQKNIILFLNSLTESMYKENNSIYYFRLSQKLLSNKFINDLYNLILIVNSKQINNTNTFISLNNCDYNKNTGKTLDSDKNNYAMIYYDYDYTGNLIELSKVIKDEDLFHNEALRSWFNETFVKDYDYYVLNEDARDSYNNWLKQKGYATISHKNFLDKLENHEIFKEQDLALAQRKRPGNLIHSQFVNSFLSKNDGYKPREAGNIVSHIKFIKFK